MISAISPILATCLIVITNLSYADNSRALDVPTMKIKALAQQDEVSELVKQNDRKISLKEILVRDNLWMKSAQKPTHYLNKSLQYYFEGIIEQPGSRIVELILMGSQGETLAAFPTPTDYWQGDEAKFMSVMADESTFVDRTNWDESSQTISAQVSVPVKDQSGEVLGVLTGAIEATVRDLGEIKRP